MFKVFSSCTLFLAIVELIPAQPAKTPPAEAQATTNPATDLSQATEINPPRPLSVEDTTKPKAIGKTSDVNPQSQRAETEVALPTSEEIRPAAPEIKAAPGTTPYQLFGDTSKKYLVTEKEKELGDTASTRKTLQDFTNITQSEAVKANATPAGTPMPINLENKHNIPIGVGNIALTGNIDFFSSEEEVTPNPLFSKMFPDMPDVAEKLTIFYKNVIEVPSAIPFLRKIQLDALYEIYNHLIKIYATLNMTHFKDLKQYLEYDRRYAISEKSLIVLNLLSLVDSQVTMVTQQIFPGIPALTASTIGSVATKYSTGTDITFLIKQHDDVEIEAIRYYIIKMLQQYIGIMFHITSFLDYRNLDMGVATKLYDVIYDIHAFTQQEGKIHDIIKPKIFLINPAALRAIHLLPDLARRVEGKEQVPWPTHVVEKAKSGARVTNQITGLRSPFPLATLKDKYAMPTHDPANAEYLFINLPLGQNIFEMELAQEPPWLSYEGGVLAMAKACLGNLAMAMGLKDVLSPFMRAIIYGALEPAGGKKMEDALSTFTNVAEQYLGAYSRGFVIGPAPGNES